MPDRSRYNAGPEAFRIYHSSPMFLLEGVRPHAHLQALARGACVLFALACASAYAATANVPYVPTPQVVVDRMLEMARVGPRDYVIDLGSGDGRIVITAAQKLG